MKISVIIPAYNAATYIKATLQSILDQTVQPDEIIIVNDGSTDATVEVALSLNNEKIRIISQENKGLPASRNVGVAAANHPYIAFCDADDIWTPKKLALQLEAMQAYSFPVFSFTDYVKFDENGMKPGDTELNRRPAFLKTANSIVKAEDGNILIKNGNVPVMHSSYILPSSVVIRREDILAAGKFNESLTIGEDYEFFLRLFKLVPGVAVMKPLTWYRQHTQQMTSSGLRMQEEFIQIFNMIIASPNAYPPADVQYFTDSLHERYYEVGVKQARNGLFEKAITSFKQSLALKWTLKAFLVLCAAQVCQSSIGRLVFDTVRGLWLKRPGKTLG